MKKWFNRILLAMAAVFVGLSLVAAYAYFIEPSRLVIHEETLRIPNWSANLNGFKIAAMSDLHGGSNNVTEEKLRLLVSETNAQNPDLIVLLGDYVSESKKFNREALSQPGGTDRTELRMPVETIADALRGFRATYGVYAVLGNHDWWHNEQKVRREFERVGIKILENEIEPIKVGEETIYLWGIEDYWKKRRVPAEALQTIPEKKNIIAITHNPDSLLKAPGDISLMVAGHSHGGQVKFPIYGAHPFVNDARFMAGHVEVDGKHVFVTTGIGCTGPQFRFRVPPEIAVLQLFAAN